jgi:hypothetical protein
MNIATSGRAIKEIYITTQVLPTTPGSTIPASVPKDTFFTAGEDINIASR